MINVGIIGATGYVGEELVRILCKHPYVKISNLTSQNYVGQNIGDIFPNLNKSINKVCEDTDIKKIAEECDVVFLSVPAGISVPYVKEIVSSGKKVIDMGADFRFDNCSLYEKWYKVSHKEEELLKESVYGLTEINKDRIKNARIIGNPGCYPTSIILGLAPLLKDRIIDPDFIIADSKSGVSGAGRSANAANLFTEISGNLKPYNIGSHRHIPEINQELSKLYNGDISITFTPHIVPLVRGILSTMYCKMDKHHTFEEIYNIYNDFYKEKKFVRILKKKVYPQIKWVCGSNYCDIGFEVDETKNMLVIVSAIDNLLKGAAGQAIQNMNIMFGFPEDTGLEFPGAYI